MDAMVKTQVTTRDIPGCPCEGKTLERLIRPAVLMILAREEEYGYRIVQHLTDMPMFDGQKPNAAGVYRCLKTMAEEGLVVSSWSLSETGPAKRLYTLTSHGEHCLASWLITLTNYRQSIDALLEIGQQVITKWRDRAGVSSAG
ncbi:MAG: PadR family transcriptional regulator [Armatimonadota bacterium]